MNRVATVATPTLDDLARDPARARDLPPELARDLLLQLAPLVEDLRLRAVAGTVVANGQPAPAEPDRLLTPEEAAERLGVTVAWLYRHAKRLPFTRRLSRKCLRFSEAALGKWQAAKRA